jgi:phage repressor protein C with HTH and peptisase S24 domain
MPYLAARRKIMHFCIMLSPEHIYEVLEKRRQELGLSQVDVSVRAFGRADNSAFQSIRRGSSPSVEKLEALAKAMGLEFRFGGVKEASVAESHLSIDGRDFAAVPLISAEVSAGPGAENGDSEIVDLLAFRHDWLKRLGVRTTNACLVRVRGDSMSPRLQPGDLALIDQGRTKVVSGRVYALNDVGGPTRIKRLELPEPSTLLLRSDNPDHPIEMRRGTDLNRLMIVGEVVWSGHTWA